MILNCIYTQWQLTPDSMVDYGYNSNSSKLSSWCVFSLSESAICIFLLLMSILHRSRKGKLAMGLKTSSILQIQNYHLVITAYELSVFAWLLGELGLTTLTTCAFNQHLKLLIWKNAHATHVHVCFVLYAHEIYYSKTLWTVSLDLRHVIKFCQY